MATLAWFDTALLTRIVLTFGHFLWQGAAIALIVLLLSVAFRKSPARLRYMYFLSSLMLMTICPVVTFLFVQTGESGPVVALTGRPILASESDSPGVLSSEIAVVDVPTVEDEILAGSPGEFPELATLPDSIEEIKPEALASNSSINGGPQPGRRWQWAVPYLTVVYLLGVMLLLGRLLLGLHGGRRLRHQGMLIDEPELLSGIARSAKMLGMQFTPTVLYCKQVAIPTVVGVFRPAILLPLSLTTGLSPDQVEAVLTHELAHVRRYDHLVNIFQRVIESLLFFHPAVWWISHRIRVERENCCDDIVVSLGAEPLSYAACLIDIAERGQSNRPSRQLETAAALHAAKSGSQLSQRVKRLVNGASGEALRLSRGGHVFMLICLALLVSSAALLQGQIANSPSMESTRHAGNDTPTEYPSIYFTEDQQRVGDYVWYVCYGTCFEDSVEKLTFVFFEGGDLESRAGMRRIISRTLSRTRKLARRTQEGWLIDDYMGARMIQLPTATQLYEAKNRKLVTSDERVDLEQLKGFLASKPKEYSIRELLAFVNETPKTVFDPVVERTLSLDDKNGPRAVVAKWIESVLADSIPVSRALTTKPSGSPLNAEHDLPRLANKDRVHVERALGNESSAVVVTNAVKHVKTGKDLAFAFWLVRRDGSWLIDTASMRFPEIIEEQLRGFSLGGSGGVKWRVTNDDLVGSWLGGPGKAGGAGGSTCESRFQLRGNGTFKLEMWGPGGRDNVTKVKRGTWRLEEDRIIRSQDNQRLVSRVSWMGNDSLVLQPVDSKSLDGRAGTHYHREKVVEKQPDGTRREGAGRESGGEKVGAEDQAVKGDSPSKAQPTKTAAVESTAKAIKNGFIPAADSNDGNVILDLASGDMVPIPEQNHGKEFVPLGKGDLAYALKSVICLRGAKALIWHKDRPGPIPGKQKGDTTFYSLPNTLPCRMLVTTAEKKQFDVTILSKTKDSGIFLKYHTVTEAPAKSTDADADSKRLQATWKVLAAEKNGDAQPDSNTKFVFHAGRFQMFDSGEEAASGTYTIDPSQSPNTIDLQIVGQPELPIIKGIYDFPGPGKLRLCYGDKPNWRPTRFDSKQDGGNVAVVELRLEARDATVVPKSSNRDELTPAKSDKVFNESTKKAHLSNAEGGPGAKVDDFLGLKFILNLASGQMLAFPDNVLKKPGQSGQFITNQKLGDLLYAGHSLFCLRGAKAMQWDGNRFIPMKQGDFATSSKRTKHLTRYELTKFPCRLLITTAEKKQFDVTVLAETKDGGIDLEFRLAAEAP